ncbi:Arylsulfatase [Bacteroidales bacterium Barb7]|nr:Arylsulfatase [Bacteroidales bacterium Barb7]
MTRNQYINALAALAGLPMAGGLFAQQNNSEFKGIIGKTYETSEEYWIDRTNPVNGFPNVVWVVLDDVGFGASSTFGGLIRTPNFDHLANAGLRYTNFHTCGISAPTRAALLTGRNHHTVHMGGFAHKVMSAGFPGYDGYIPENAGTIAEVLKSAGYNTFAVGKYGVTPDDDTTDAGPFDRWPSGKGFEKFFGFLGSQTDQYKPNLVEDNTFITPDGRHLSEQITDRAITYIQKQKEAAPGKPFFLYYAPAAVHAPHQVAKKWRDEYKGQFDEGWDVYRKKVFEQQKKLGIIPANAILPERDPKITSWDKLSSDEKKLYARFMETYAAYLTYTDYEVGRVIKMLEELKQLDNTVIFVLIGDNGASKEGDFSGTIGQQLFNLQANAGIDLFQKNLENIELIGEPEGINVNYPLGWAQAANVPFKYWKSDANSEGGTRNPLIVHYPNGIKDKGGIRNQYGHVIDLFPTTLDLTGISVPEQIKGIKQTPIQGTSLAYSFNEKDASPKHTIQYSYIFGSGSIYQDGWKASFAYHPDVIDIHLQLPKGQEGLRELFTLANRVPEWELYNLNEDFNERNDLAAKNPQKLAELQVLFDQQAQENNVYPLINWGYVFTKGIANRNAKDFGKIAGGKE